MCNGGQIEHIGCMEHPSHTSPSVSGIGHMVDAWTVSAEAEIEMSRWQRLTRPDAPGVPYSIDSRAEKNEGLLISRTRTPCLFKALQDVQEELLR